MKRWYVVGFCLFVSYTQASEGVPDSLEVPHQMPDKFAVETFTPPVRTLAKPPRYPDRYLNSRREGWVTMSYMVDTQGVPYDVSVVSSSEGREFERAAVKAVEKFRYTPADLNGRAIDAGVVSSITFAFDHEKPGARKLFRRAYKRPSKSIDVQDRERADKEFEKIAKLDRNLYEEAFYQLARYSYAVIWGDLSTQYEALQRAAFLDRAQEFLPDKQLTSVLLAKLATEVNLFKYAEALKTAQILVDRDLDADGLAIVNKVVGEIKALQSAPGSQFSVAGKIKQDNRYTHRLLRQGFYFSEIEGAIAEVRLHCDKGYVGFAYEQGMMYTVTDNYRDCWVVVIGDPDSTFTLVES